MSESILLARIDRLEHIIDQIRDVFHDNETEGSGRYDYYETCGIEIEKIIKGMSY